jgi:predicted nucleic acid-binding protein
MQTSKYLIDTNILIYHVAGSPEATAFISKVAAKRAFNVSIITEIEFLGWNKHTEEGFKKCKRMLEAANIYELDENIAQKTIELRRKTKIKLADAVIAATAIINNFTIVTRNTADFKMIDEVSVLNPFHD